MFRGKRCEMRSVVIDDAEGTASRGRETKRRWDKASWPSAQHDHKEQEQIDESW
jgi:hypothetical protein